MRRFLVVLLAALTLQAAERWVESGSGPFQVLSSAGERAGRDRLYELEEFRYVFEQTLGRQDIEPAWPIRVLVVDSTRNAPLTPGFARDAWIAAVPSRGALARPFLRALAVLFFDAGAGRLPDEMEAALADLFSTLDFRGWQPVLGAPLPAAERTREWAKMHMLSVSTGYYGRLRTLVYNLERGVDPEAAYRNAFSKTLAEVDKEAEAYLRAGEFKTIEPRRRPLNPERDFELKPVEAARAPILMADLLLSDPVRPAQAGAAYQAILKSSPESVEAREGLALAALAEGRKAEARGLLARAMEIPGASARTFLEYGRLETDRDKALVALEKAAKLNPRWAEPHFEMARLERDPQLRIQLLAAAAQRDPRNVGYWRALAEAQEAASRFADAAKSWATAETAAGSAAERERLRASRLAAEVQRREEDEAARQRKIEEERRELEALKQRARAGIEAAIAKANRENPPMAPSSGKVEPWFEGPRPDAKLTGLLRQVDCLGAMARLVVEGGDRKVTRLLIRDPAQVEISGGGEKSLGCGVQKPARRVVIEYFLKPDAKFGTAGDVAVLQFP
ncbi:MAG: hypothetical protein IT159_02030 [Bryobacterales bacterium]|nr:hypothetical protein [Bryobacterales bacterium]